MGGEETRAEQHAFGAERKRPRETAAVGDAAGAKHRQWREGFDHHRYERQRRHPTDVAAGFRPLRYQDVGARFSGAQSFGQLRRPCT